MKQNKPIAPEPRAISPVAFAQRYGYNARTVHRWCDEGMPHVGNGRARRVFWQEALVWLSTRETKSKTPVVHQGMVLQ